MHEAVVGAGTPAAGALGQGAVAPAVTETHLDLPLFSRGKVRVVSGAAAREKVVRVEGLAAAELGARLP